MLSKISSALFSLVCCTSNLAHAEELPAPTLALSMQQTTVTASWSSVPNATQYTLFYAPYPAAAPISSLDMGNNTSISVNLNAGAAYYVAVKANNLNLSSNYSNIEHFIIPDNAMLGYKPAVGVTWQWQLKGTLNTRYNAELYDIDLFDTPVTTIQSLKAAGKKVICYFSAGSYEDWRSDQGSFNAADLGNPLEDWPGERWLNIRSTNVAAIMSKRFDLAKSKGCDGVEPDNVDAYTNDNGLKLTAAEQLTYNKFLANEAHKRGLAVALKNDLDQVRELVGYFDFSVNEQCHEYDECAQLTPFINANKPVLNAEYASKYRQDPSRKNLCTSANAAKLSTLILPLELDDTYRYSCQ